MTHLNLSGSTINNTRIEKGLHRYIDFQFNFHNNDKDEINKIYLYVKQ